MEFLETIGSEASGLMGAELIALLNITIIDLVLAGDNAIIVGMAASRVDPSIRAKVIVWGMAGAVILRIVFALITTQLLAIVGLTLAGGILLLWVCWKMYREIMGADHLDPSETFEGAEKAGENTSENVTMGFRAALMQIIVADVSMSLDNVLAVAGAAKGNTLILVFGLALAILAMAVAANYIARLLAKYPWISWVGLLIILYVSLDMIWRGSHEVACQAYDGYWCHNDLFDLLTARLGF